MSALRVVLDTNVVVSSLLFRHGRLSVPRSKWQSGLFVPVASRGTMDELHRILGYRKFHLDAESIVTALALYLPYVEVYSGPVSTSAWLCRDPKDQMFLDLADAAKVDCLVTGDEDLLALEEPFREHLHCQIATPQDFLTQIAR